jgi:cytoskeletal protein RodZ
MPTVGEILSAERRRQGKQLSDVVEGTKIRSRLIDALEQGRYDVLPSPAYVKGYIQSYARYLEIPVEPLLEQFKAESVDTVRRTAPIDRYLQAIPAETVVPRRDLVHEIPRNVWIAVVAGVVFVLLLVCVIAGWLVPALTGLPPSSSGTPASPGATSSIAATNTSSASLGFTLRVSVRTGLASSVKVTIDGHVDFNGSMQDGASKEYLVKDTAVLEIGNPDAVVVTRDGQTVSVTAGEPLTLSATN